MLTFAWDKAMFLFTLTNTLWIAFLVLFAVLWLERHNINRSEYWLGFLIWAGHGIILYTTILIARLFFGYIGPSVFFTTWSAGLIVHAVAAIAGPAIIRIMEMHRINGTGNEQR